MPSIESKPSRKGWIDALRAVAMLFVMVGHQARGAQLYYLFTSPVKLPLFFAISGYLFNAGRPPRAFFANLVRRLAVPWAIATFGAVLAMTPLRGIGSLPAGIRGIFADVTLWYICCCFFAELIWYAVLRLCRSTAAVCLAAAALCALGLVMARFHILDAMTINNAFIAQAFLLIGWLFRRHEDRLARLGWGPVLALAGFYVLLGVISRLAWPGVHIDVHTNRYDFVPFSMLMIYAGCASLLLIGRKLDFAPRALCFIGQNTLIYYMAHNYVISALNRAWSLAGVSLPYWPAIAVNTALACVACGVLSALVNRFLPELAGRRRQPRRAGA